MRAGQRIIAELAEIGLAGGAMLELREDSASRSHLTRSLTLIEVRRDQFAFYHDVLRDWGIGNLIHEDHTRLSGIDLTVPASPRVARGIEIAARLALEASRDCTRWLSLLGRLSPTGAHSSWRRHGLLAIVRSEVGPDLLERCSKALLTRGGALFAELVTMIVAVDTISIAELYAAMQVVSDKPVPKSLRTITTGTGHRLLMWVLAHANETPVRAIGAAVDLVGIQIQLLLILPEASLVDHVHVVQLAASTRRAGSARHDPGGRDRRANGQQRPTSNGRRPPLHSPVAVRALTRRRQGLSSRDRCGARDTHKVKAIRQFSTALVSARQFPLSWPT